MHYKTKEFTFKSNEELDAELAKMYKQAGWEVVAVLSDRWFGKEYGGKAVIKFKVK